MLARVLVEIKAQNLDKTFTYHVRSELENYIKKGIRVKVPFGKQTLEGFVLECDVKEEVEYELKDIIEVIDKEPVINEEMLELGKFISKNTFSNLICAYQTMLPSALKAKNGLTINKKYVTYLKLNIKDYEGNTIAARNVLKLFEDKEYVLKSDATKVSVSAVKTLLEHKVLEEIQKEVYRIDEESKIEECKITLNEEQSYAFNEVKKS